MVEGETATFFDSQDVAAVAEAVERCMMTSWSPGRLRENAARFSEERFVAAFSEAIAATVAT